MAPHNRVVVGAQVGYRDLVDFGRRLMDVTPTELTDDVVYHFGALHALCQVSGTRVQYVKPHGALYDAVVHHQGQALAVAAAVRAYDPALPVLGLPGSPACCAVGSATAMSSTVSAHEVRGGSVDTTMFRYARERCTTNAGCSTPY